MFVVLGMILTSTLSFGWQDYCLYIESEAKEIMYVRQMGVSMSDVMKVALKMDNELIEEIIIDAYQYDIFLNDDIKVMIIKEFGNIWYGYCIKALR